MQNIFHLIKRGQPGIIASGSPLDALTNHLTCRFHTFLSLNITTCQVIKNSGTNFVDFPGFVAARDKHEKKKV